MRELESPDLVRVSLQDVRRDRWEGCRVAVAVGEKGDGGVGGVEDAVETLVGLGLLEEGCESVLRDQERRLDVLWEHGYEFSDARG